MIEARRRRFEAHGFQHVGRTKSGHGAGQQRLVPRRFHKGLSGEVVDLVRLHVAQDADERGDVGQVAVDQPHILLDAKPAEFRADDVGGGAAPHQAINLIALVQEELRQVGAVLPGDTRYQCTLHP